MSVTPASRAISLTSWIRTADDCTAVTMTTALRARAHLASDYLSLVAGERLHALTARRERIKVLPRPVLLRYKSADVTEPGHGRIVNQKQRPS